MIPHEREGEIGEGEVYEMEASETSSKSGVRLGVWQAGSAPEAALAHALHLDRKYGQRVTTS